MEKIFPLSLGVYIYLNADKCNTVCLFLGLIFIAGQSELHMYSEDLNTEIVLTGIQALDATTDVNANQTSM